LLSERVGLNEKMRTWTTKSGYLITRVLSGRSNVFLLSDKTKNILIDTSPKFMWGKLLRQLKQLNINRIDYLVLTHTHFDHAENSNKIKEKYNAQVIVHQNEVPFLTTGENILPQGTNPISKTIVRLFAKQFISLAKYEPCQVNLTVDSVFDLADFGFNAFISHTPGHTTGSVSVIIDDEIALVGDTLFGVFPWSVYPPFANDTIKMIESWGKLLETKCKVFIPSHGSAIPRSRVEKDYNRRKKSINTAIS
jgi:hydroxyacylglutathione hydrolase